MQRRHVLQLLALGIAGAAAPAFVRAAAPRRFVDDAHRTVNLPGTIVRVFAAGAPAEVLLYTLAPEKLVGRNHMPSPAALEFMPEAFQRPVQIMRLPNADDADQDAELLALKPDLYVDYGDVTGDYVGALEKVQRRTGIPGITFDGALERIPFTYRRLGALLGVEMRAERLASHTEHLLTKYRRALQSDVPPRAYLACSRDGSIPCFEDERNGEIATFLGATNVAGSANTAPLRPITRDDLKNWDPDVIIVANAATAENWLSDPQTQSLRAVRNGHVYAPPALPFSWGPRPPSVNRLLGVIWFAHVLPGKRFDAEFYREVRDFFRVFFQVDPGTERLRALVEHRSD